jgi:hypothetical protein
VLSKQTLAQQALADALGSDRVGSTPRGQYPIASLSHPRQPLTTSPTRLRVNSR